MGGKRANPGLQRVEMHLDSMGAGARERFRYDVAEEFGFTDEDGWRVANFYRAMGLVK